MARKRTTLLTNLELQVMRVVWAADEPLTVREVTEQLNLARSRPLAYNTVQTMLTILRQKGAVALKRGPGRAHRFRARVTKEEVSTSMVGDLVERLFDGRVEPLLVQLVGNETLSRDELRALKELIQSQLDGGPEGDPR